MNMMLSHLILLILSLMAFMHGLDGSSCDEDCTDKPVFSPSRLVVKHGDQVSASCTPCQHACQSNQSNLDVSIGQPTKDGNTILWKVDSMTEWNASAMCFYFRDDGNMCCNHLPVTVYQPPVMVRIYPTRDDDSDRFIAECVVYDVAPVENLIVTFYSGQTELGQFRSNNTSNTPVTERFTLNLEEGTPYDQSSYWCEAKLDLGPGGPQHSPVAKSREHLHMLMSSATVIHNFSFLIFFLVCLTF